MFAYLVVTFVLMASFFLFIGIQVVMTKRPYFMSSRYFFVFMILAFSLQFVNTFWMITKDMPGNLSLIFYLNPLLFILVLVFLWIQLKGYMAIGVSDDSFRDALHFSLNKNGLDFEEQLSVVKLTSIDAILQVAIQSWVGAGQIKLKRSKDKNVLPQIISGLNDYYSENNIKPNIITPIFYIILGVFMLILAGVFYFALNNIDRL